MPRFYFDGTETPIERMRMVIEKFEKQGHQFGQYGITHKKSPHTKQRNNISYCPFDLDKPILIETYYLMPKLFIDIPRAPYQYSRQMKTIMEPIFGQHITSGEFDLIMCALEYNYKVYPEDSALDFHGKWIKRELDERHIALPAGTALNQFLP